MKRLTSKKGLKNVAVILALFVALACVLALRLSCKNADADETEIIENTDLEYEEEITSIQIEPEETPFSYVHDPLQNTAAKKNIAKDEDAVYGFSPKSGSNLAKKYIDVDFSDESEVENLRQKRISHYTELDELYHERKHIELISHGDEEFAKTFIKNIDDNHPQLNEYTDENGEKKSYTVDELKEKYGSYLGAIESFFEIDSSLDACLGLYDDYYFWYILYGEVERENDMYITGNNVCLRVDPDAEAYALGLLYYDNEVYACSSENGWTRVISSVGFGYVSNDYIKSISEREAVDGKDIVEYAKTFENTKYKWGGKTPDEGFDCSGFTLFVYDHFGIPINRIASDQALNGVEVKYADISEGDLILFQSGGYISHCGIYIGDGKVIHSANSSSGVLIANLSVFGTEENIVARRLK